MFHLIYVILAILLASTVTFIGMDYRGNQIVMEESNRIKAGFDVFTQYKDRFDSNYKKPILISQWRDDVQQYGPLPSLPPNTQYEYNYSTTENRYYLCIYNNTPDLRTHNAFSRLRYGFPRTTDSEGNKVLSTHRGYDASIFNINESCGATTDYYEDGTIEPTEDGDTNRPVAATMWFGGFVKYYIEQSNSIRNDFINIKDAFDAYVLDNEGIPPSTTLTASEFFDVLRPYGKLPKNYNNFTWEYDQGSSSYYICLGTIDTTNLTPIEREIHAESIYQITNIFDESYFKVNRTACGNNSQSKSYDYNNTINVYGTYLLN